MNVGAVPLLRCSCCQVGAVLRYVFCWVAAVAWGEYTFLLTISSMITITQWSRPPLHSNPLFPAYTTITITTTIIAATCRYCCCLCHHCCHQCHHASAITIAPYGYPTFIVSPLRLFGLNHLSMFEHNQIKQEDGGWGWGSCVVDPQIWGNNSLSLDFFEMPVDQGMKMVCTLVMALCPQCFSKVVTSTLTKVELWGNLCAPITRCPPFLAFHFCQCVEFILLSPYIRGCVMISYLWTQTALLLECLGWNLVLCFN